jgi:hypothetical protein
MGDSSVVTMVSGLPKDASADLPGDEEDAELQAAIPSARTATAATLPASLWIIPLSSKDVPGRLVAGLK